MIVYVTSPVCECELLYIDIKCQLTRQQRNAPLDEGAIVIRENEGDSTRLVLGPLKTENGYRRLYLPNFVADMLRKVLDWEREQRFEFGKDNNPHGFVFCSEHGDVFDPRTYTQIWYNIVKAAGIPRANFHCIRHTFATRCIQNGVDPTVLSRLLGHAKVSTSMDMYTHAEDDELVKASSVFNRR